MKIIVPVMAAYKKLSSILYAIFSASNHAGLLEEERLIQHNAGIADTAHVCIHNTLTITKTNHKNDAKQCDASFLFIPVTSCHAEPVEAWTKGIHHSLLPIHLNKNSFMKTFLRKSGVFAIALLIANLFLMNATFGQIALRGTSTTASAGGTTLTINKPTGLKIVEM